MYAVDSEMVSYVVEAVHQFPSVGLGDLYLRDVVKGRQQDTVVAVDDADVANVYDKLLMGTYEVRSVGKDGLGRSLAFEYNSFEVVEDAFPNFAVRHISEVDYVGWIDDDF